MISHKKLQLLGLTQNEAIVYLAILDSGHASAPALAKQSELPKSTVYDILESLRTQGLIHTYPKKGRKYYGAADPTTLVEKSKKQAELATELLPQLITRYNKHTEQKPFVRFYEGKEGFKVAVEEVLAEADELLVMTSVSAAVNSLREFFPYFPTERAKRGIKARILSNDSKEARHYQSNDSKFLRESRIIDIDLPFSSNLWLWNDKVATVSLGNHISATITEDKETSALNRAMFETLWKHAPEIK